MDSEKGNQLREIEAEGNKTFKGKAEEARIFGTCTIACLPQVPC